MVNTDFEEQLMGSLQHKAGQVRSGQSLARSAMKQAQGIRRRRRVAGAVVAAAVVAVAVPVGMGVAGGGLLSSREVPPATHGPVVPEQTEVLLDLSALETGEAPAVAYAEGQTIHAGDSSIEVPDSIPMGSAAFAWTDSGAYVSWSDGGNGSLDLVQPGGEVIHLADEFVFNLVASADGRYVAYTQGPALTFIDLDTSEMTETTLPRGDVDLLRIVDGTLWISAPQRVTDGQLWRIDVGDDEVTTVMDGANPTAVSPDGTLVTVLTEYDEMEPGSCSELRELESGSTLWETCDSQIDGFSPDGTYVLTAPEYRDGYADSSAGALDAETGDLIAEFSSDFDKPRLFASFMRSTFEDDTHLLMQVEQEGNTAIVRCDLTDNSCENAVAPQPGTVDGMNAPYVLGG